MTQYAKDAVDGRTITGQLVRQACQRHLDDLKASRKRGRGATFAYVFDEQAANDAIEFFPNLKQHKGRWAGKPLVLQPWQVFVIGSVFGWKWKTTGLRRFRTAYVSVARKNGKTTLAAGVALYMLDFDGEAGAEVYSAATKRDQAKICWTEARMMVKTTPSLRRRIRCIDSRANMHVTDTASKFEALGADADTLDGLNPHAYFVDELHAHKTRAVVDVLETAVGAREQPLAFYITTAGLERESIYSETNNYAQRILQGAVEDDAEFVYIAALDLPDPDDPGDTGDDWQDPAVYIKSNPSLGVTVQLAELIKQRDKALAVPGRANAFRRLRLNVRTGQFEAWFLPEAWDANRHEFDEEDLAGWRCYASLDLATKLDITSLVLWFPDEDEGGGWILAYFWVPEEAGVRRAERDQLPYPEWIDAGHLRATEGNVTDYDIVREDIGELTSRYHFIELSYDPWNASQLINQLIEDGAKCVQMNQTMGNLSPGAKELEAQVASKKARHNGDPVLRWMMLNAQKKEDENGNIRSDRKRSADKIDGVRCLEMALSREITAEEEESQGISGYFPEGDETR